MKKNQLRSAENFFERRRIFGFEHSTKDGKTIKVLGPQFRHIQIEWISKAMWLFLIQFWAITAMMTFGFLWHAVCMFYYSIECLH